MIEEKARDFHLLFCWISQDRLGFAEITNDSKPSWFQITKVYFLLKLWDPG